jgi:hypothetical protein
MSVFVSPTIQYVATTWPDDQVKVVKWECICLLLRACELRVRTEPFDVAYLAGIDAAEQAVHAAARDRIHDLRGCNKDDDCDVLARGADLLLDDVINELRALRQTRTENGTGVT